MLPYLLSLCSTTLVSPLLLCELLCRILHRLLLEPSAGAHAYCLLALQILMVAEAA